MIRRKEFDRESGANEGCREYSKRLHSIEEDEGKIMCSNDDQASRIEPALSVERGAAGYSENERNAICITK